MANESGTIVKDGVTYTYGPWPDDYLGHTCQEWEEATEGMFPKPRPAFQYDTDVPNRKYKISCSHCLSLLVDGNLFGGL